MKSILPVKITNIAGLNKRCVNLFLLLFASSMFAHADGDENYIVKDSERAVLRVKLRNITPKSLSRIRCS
jgi:hypothetical protein